MNKITDEMQILIDELRKGKSVDQIIAEVDDAMKDCSNVAKLLWEEKKKELLKNKS